MENINICETVSVVDYERRRKKMSRNEELYILQCLLEDGSLSKALRKRYERRYDRLKGDSKDRRFLDSVLMPKRTNTLKVFKEMIKLLADEVREDENEL